MSDTSKSTSRISTRRGRPTRFYYTLMKSDVLICLGRGAFPCW